MLPQFRTMVALLSRDGGFDMSRYTGPKARVSRRLATNIWGTKGEADALEKRPYPPGEHGRTGRRGNDSEYKVQLQEKQKA